jgi:hypothetical protein
VRSKLIAIAALLAMPALAQAGDRRPHIEQDDCARRASSCEKRCDAQARAERLSCKTDCRFAETECRNKRR